MTMTNTEAASLAAAYVGSGPSTFYSYYSENATPKISNGPWCACFASSILLMAGATAPGFPGLYCPDMCKTAKKAGATVPIAQANPGDVVFFNWDSNDNADHVGICQSVNASARTITTIDGNVSNRVGKRTRTFGEVIAVVRPKYHVAYTPEENMSYLVKAIQQFLQSKGYYKGYRIDGILAYYTVKAIQQYLKSLGIYKGKIDGDFGAYTSKIFLQALESGKFC